jgi:uncharacterized membrane protein YqjE
MVRLLIRLASAHPHLLADHAQAYWDLVGSETGVAARRLKRRAVLGGLALVCGVLALGLAGVAVMLWAVMPEGRSGQLQPGVQAGAQWLLLAVPLVPALIAAVCAWSASRSSHSASFEQTRRQLAADLAVLRLADAQ